MKTTLRLHRSTHPIHVAAVAAIAVGAWGCHSAPVQKPIYGGAVETGAGSLEATRRALEGTWNLQTLEVVDARGARRGVKASGQLMYDAFGSMNVRGTVEDPALTDTLVINFQGRIVLDTVRHEFYPADLVSDRPVDASQIQAISPDKVRRYELSGNSLVVTYLDKAAKPTAVIHWSRSSAPAAPSRP
jgi:hypothetical protein